MSTLSISGCCSNSVAPDVDFASSCKFKLIAVNCCLEKSLSLICPISIFIAVYWQTLPSHTAVLQFWCLCLSVFVELMFISAHRVFISPVFGVRISLWQQQVHYWTMAMWSRWWLWRWIWWEKLWSVIAVDIVVVVVVAVVVLATAACSCC